MRGIVTKHDLLANVRFGQRVAEDEGDLLETYFVETDHWRRLFSGEVDVVYGPKGAGKSALYSLLLARSGQLRGRNILLVPGENPRGAPAFKDLVTDPPASEPEFIALWKLYIASLLLQVCEDNAVRGEAIDRLRGSLEREGLVRRGRSLQSLLRSVVDYVRAATRPAAIEAGLEFDPATQLPKGFSGKISFREPSAAARDTGVISVDELLQAANEALAAAARSAWVLLDRLDVAFAESSDLEHNALRALFRVYLDLLALEQIRLKIFLRTDIWRRITAAGFREASHITRHLTIDWNARSLLNLVVSRAIQNDELQRFYSTTRQAVLISADSQREFFYRMCPDQVDVGPNKPSTFDWMLGRTRDGLGTNAPRELIHLLNSLREVQVRRLETGDAEPEGSLLFARTSFKEALPEVSRVRLEQTLFAEYPALRHSLEKLRGAKTLHTVDTLSELWGIDPGQAQKHADELVEVGFVERRGTRERPEYWVPFLYRDALDLVQGAAE